MVPSKANFFSNLPDARQSEVFSEIIGRNDVKIARIVSCGQVTPEGQWYDQQEHEWVMLLQGAARLQFADGEEVALAAGEHIDIPAHCRHRVSWTAPTQQTVWLAVFYGQKIESSQN